MTQPTRKDHCEAVGAAFWSPERCLAPPFVDVAYQGETWTVCREHLMLVVAANAVKDVESGGSPQ